MEQILATTPPEETEGYRVDCVPAAKRMALEVLMTPESRELLLATPIETFRPRTF
jgi:hypothetical protein